MSKLSPGAQASETPSRVNGPYFTAWRWHFYAGLYVIPFLMMLAISGALMVWFTAIAPEYGERLAVTPAATAQSVSAQVAAAEAAHPGSHADKYIAPHDARTPAIVRVQDAGTARMLAVDPYSGAVLADRTEAGTWNDWLTHLHGELLWGDNGGPGDALIEIAASLGMVMLVSGLYLSWPRNGTPWRAVFLPDLRARGRKFWKSLHLTTGVWVSLLLVFFLLTGLSWAGIWGGKLVQPWSSFPAAKWEAVPLSDETHAAMNHTAREEVPWTLELTPMPRSGSQAGAQLLPHGTPVTFETVMAGARALGFAARVQVSAPADGTGVWTLSRDSMSYDSPDPTADRTVHVDQYTGKILADVRFADYPLMGKAMAVGIALHEGQMGLWNIVLNLAVCGAFVLSCVAGTVLWWKRRPVAAGRLAAPPRAPEGPLWKGGLIVAAIVALAFPLAGAAILAVLLLDALVLRHLPGLKRVLS
ncbi:PepSY domain-containing protein [Rhodobacter capsulatus]|uniref:PepSY domain-containing protein n=1 Tax=Rhodobacter capsulatus TaxID=1061 RepID=A0A4U1JTP4_RHOCA|nr:PepSY domain-containing protein [Rhodobacter capsulatus]TKD22682.1 PepSY domain-containing protein [Rhodobacter capsulatus]